MEMACDNMVEPGDEVLVFVSGIWGQRFAEMVSRHGMAHLFFDLFPFIYAYKQ